MSETFTVAPMTMGDAEITITIEAVGGHTKGRAYAHNAWHYIVRFAGKSVISGKDLHSNATAATAAKMAHSLASFLSADAEEGSLSQYKDDARAFLEAEGERLGYWASENEEA
jgi:hypothetical protein